MLQRSFDHMHGSEKAHSPMFARMDDGYLVPWILRVHAIAGGIALVVAPLAMALPKGGTWHRRWGKAYFYRMVVVCITAVVLGIAHYQRSFWLALVGVFSFHLVASGYRSLYLKKLHEGLKPQPTDLWLHGIAGTVNGGLLIWGLAHLLMGQRDTKAMLFTVFGAIGSYMVVIQLHRFYKRKHDKREWFYGHISGMLGAYIATLSAFSAVNLEMIRPTWLKWLWPTLVGVPLIILWTGHYRRRFAKGARVRDMAEVRIR